MPIIKTQEELLASKIKPRNPSSVLSAIYFLKNRVAADYTPSAPSRLIWASSDIGTGSGTSKSFTALSPTTYNKNTADITITLAGTATYLLTNGASTIGPKPTIKLVAQIDIANNDSGFPPFQVEAVADADPVEINSNGTFSFKIPNSIIKQLSVGQHTVYIDAFSPAGPTRLTVSGVSDGIQKFVITES